ncbi:Lrp/AsnC family transcriptional regulator [Neptunicoccus cionae]|uniref:Lrp/AsnC family transcriptional regulator n=1 Tax=Neptunicoccus cionae TaxID=2035344 RepID=UPI000C78F2FD|nr:Lrp/AsnC family transcriptional regulator [Amylibacter cionae]PLS21335.1 Lrp/AsnC family transcriptional regulator [Amylibacter cionae]
MDEIDQRLLTLLGKDARTSASDLAAKLKVSRGTVQNRIGRMQDQGIIKRFTVELGNGQQDQQISAFTLIRVAADDGKLAIAALKRIEGVMDISTLSGEFDLVVELRTGSLRELDSLLDKIRAIKDVAQTQSHIRLMTVAR